MRRKFDRFREIFSRPKGERLEGLSKKKTKRDIQDVRDYEFFGRLRYIE